MYEEVTFLLSGIVFGLIAGMSPGPLLALVISQTLKYNKLEGIKVGIAPLLTNLPIILMTVLVISKLSDSAHLLGIISLLGAAFLSYLAYESIFIRKVELKMPSASPNSIKKGMLTDVLSPSPYVFWFAIGAPTLLKAFGVSILSAALFLAGFYICLVGSNIMTALMVEKSKAFFKSKSYIYVIKLLGLVLLVFAFRFLMDGLRMLGVIR